ncbi:MAG: bifunctional DNA primase/polymerase [Acidimicrobiia bacterium]
MNVVYASVARRYRDAGWAGVLPLPAGKKWPPPTGYTGAEGADPTDQEIHTWIDRQPDGNVGIRVPEGVVGYDADLYKPEGRHTHAELVARCGPLPATWVSTSRDDGSGISFYRIPGGVKLHGGFGGVEIIQRHHRYAVVAPSVHPDTGRPYRWITPDGDISVDGPRPEDLPWLPEVWLEALREQPAAPAGPARPRLTGDWARCVRERLGDATAALAGGSRHDAALGHALALGRFEELGYPGAGEALDSLGVSFRAQIADRDPPPSPREADAEWRRIVESARAKVSTSPSTIPRWEDSGEHHQRQVREWQDDIARMAEPRVREATPGGGGDPTQSEDVAGRPQPHDVACWADLPPEQAQPAVIQDLLYRGQVLGVAGEEGDGKTLLAQQLCHQLSRGEPILGTFDVGDLRPQRILFIDTEMTEEDAKPRAAEMARRGLAVDPDRFFWVCTGALDLPGAEDRSYIDGLLDQYDADFVWIDAGGSAIDDANDPRLVRAFFAWLQHRVREGRLIASGITLHPRKRAQGEYGRRFDDLFGSREWKGKLSKAAYIDADKITFWKDRGHHLHRRFPPPPGERYPRATLQRPGVTSPDAVPFVVTELQATADFDQAAVVAQVIELLTKEPDRHTKTATVDRLKVKRADGFAVVNHLLAEQKIGPDRPRAVLRVLNGESSQVLGNQDDKTAGQTVLELTGTDRNPSPVSISSQVPNPFRGELGTGTDAADTTGTPPAEPTDTTTEAVITLSAIDAGATDPERLDPESVDADHSCARCGNPLLSDLATICFTCDLEEP